MATQSSLTPLVEEWRERLEARLDEQSAMPEHPFAWRWQIEIKVLRLLLSRYENNASLQADKGLKVEIPLYFAPTATLKNEKRGPSPSRRLEILNGIAKTNPPVTSNSPTLTGKMFFLDEESLQKHNWKRMQRSPGKRYSPRW